MSKNEQVTETPDLPPLPGPNVPVGGKPPVAPVEPGHPPAVSSTPGAAFPAPPVAPVAGGVPQTDGKAVAALVCAILSWFVAPIVLAMVALFLARSAEKTMNARPAELSGRGLVTGARWVAWVHLVLAAMVVAFLSAFAIALWIGR